jgi:hypothetical protein
VSHSTLDRAFVEGQIIPSLRRCGVEPWYSESDIRGADAWERSIVAGLESCDWFLVVMSPRSAESEWVKDEVHWALDNRPGRVVPVLIEECDPIRFHLRLRRIQYVDFRGNRAKARAMLAKALEMGKSTCERSHPVGAIRET